MEFTLSSGLARHHTLGVRPIRFEFRQHPGRDGGVRTSGAKILSLEKARFNHALLILDHEGCGSQQTPLKLESKLDSELKPTWGPHAKTIVIDPELDIWAWGSDNLLAEILRWPLEKSIRAWLETEGFEFGDHGKPVRPKEALEAVFPICKLPRSASNYKKIAARISLAKCRDPAFQRLKTQLQTWFPISSSKP